LGAWAGGLWITPFGPTWFGISWLPFLMIAFFLALLLAAATPTQRPRTRSQAIAQERAEEAAANTLNVFFWLLIVGFVVAIIAAYL
jgi:hypothetical protein